MLPTGSHSLIGLAALATAAQAVSLAAHTQGPLAAHFAELEGLGAEPMYLAETEAARGRAKRGLGRRGIADIQADAPISSKASGSYIEKGGQWVYENREEIAEVALEIAQQGLQAANEFANDAKKTADDAWQHTQDYAAIFAGQTDQELEFICTSTGVCYKEGLKELQGAYEKANDFANDAFNEVMNAEHHAEELENAAKYVAENVARELGDIAGRLGRTFMGKAGELADGAGEAWNDAAGAVNQAADEVVSGLSSVFSGWLAEITEEERQKISFALDLEDGSIENTTDPAVMQAILDLLDLGEESRPEPARPEPARPEPALPVDDFMSNYWSDGNQMSFDLNF